MMGEVVFHYCSVETLYLIITNGALRLSDVVKSNDNLEVMWVKKVLLEMIEQETMCYELFGEAIKKEISIDFYREKLKEKVESFFERKEVKSKFFAICFSGQESEDQLSQWRGYGDDGRGVAIAFDKELLSKTKRTFILNSDDKWKIEFGKVEYEVDEQKNILKRFWEEQVIIANREIKSVEVDFELWLVKSFYELYWKAIFMKNPFFKEENESRIVFEKEESIDDKEIQKAVLGNKIQIKEGEFVVKNGNIVEYYDLDITKLKNGFIKKIILGPKCKIEQEDIQRLFQKNEYRQVKVVWSKGSYR